MLYKPGPLRSATAHRSDGQSRDLRSVCENLEKGLERRDLRNDNMSRELTSLREALANQQRENRMLLGTFDKLNAERSFLSNDFTKSKEHISRLENQIARLSDSQLLLDHTSKLQQTIDSLQMKLEKSQGSLSAKDGLLKSAEKELDALHRAFDIQDRYELPRSNGHVISTGAMQVDRDKMKSLYYELGKRQSDAHSLTLVVADSSIEISHLKQCLSDAEDTEKTARVEMAKLRQKCLDSEKKIVDAGQELADSLGLLVNCKESCCRSAGQVEDLSRRLSELRTTSDATISEKETLVFELSSLLYTSQLEVVSLNGRMDELKLSVTHLQSASDLSDQRSMSNLNEAISERKLLAERLREAEMVRPQLKLVHEHLEQAILEKEKKEMMIQTVEHNSMRDVAQARFVAEELQRDLEATQQQFYLAQQHASNIEDERAQALSSLEQMIEATKSLTAKLHAEKDMRVASEERAIKAERLADSLQKAKDHVSSAVLDALHEEKSKSMRLEKVLHQMVNSRDYDSHRDLPSTSLSSSVGRDATAAEYDNDRHKSASAKSSISGFAERFEPSLRSKRSLQGGGTLSPPRGLPNRGLTQANSRDTKYAASEGDLRKSVASATQLSPPRNATTNDTSIAFTESVNDNKNLGSRDISVKSVPFGAASRTVVEGLTRLRDHLREIEDGAPSPLNQSKVTAPSAPTSDIFHRYTSQLNEADSRGDTSSLEAEPEGWHEGGSTRSLMVTHTRTASAAFSHSWGKEEKGDSEASRFNALSGRVPNSEEEAQRMWDTDSDRIRDEFSVFGRRDIAVQIPITVPAFRSYDNSFLRDSRERKEDDEKSPSLFDLAM